MTRTTQLPYQIPDPYVQGNFDSFFTSSGAAQVGFDSTLSYSASTVGKSLADLYGQHQTNAGNPTQDGGLIGLAPDGNSTKAVRRDYTPLTGTRTSAVIANTIEVSDGQSGPASSAGVSTASSASYALSLINVRPSWNTAGTTGEADGLNVFIRQASGDAASVVSNVGARSGFACFAETYTFSADSAGAVVKAINTSIGVVNSRDGGEYGMNVIASAGALTAAYRAQQTGTSTFTDWIQFVNSSGGVVFRVRAADAAILGGTVAPLTDFGGDLGGAAARFSTSYSRYMNVTEGAAASVPTPAAGTQTLFIDSADHKLKRKDSSGTVTVIA